MSNPYLELLAKLETRGGEATIKGPKGEDSNNLYNIKLTAAEQKAGKVGYWAKDVAEGSNDFYKVFGSKAEADQEVTSLITRRYPKAAAAMAKPWSPESVEEFAKGLKEGGYATDPEYVNKLVNVAKGIKTSGERAADVATVNAQVEAGVQAMMVKPRNPNFVLSQESNEFLGLRIKQEAQPTGLERLGAAMSGSTSYAIIDAIKERLFSHQFQESPGFVPDMKALPPGSDRDLIDEYANARSPEHAQHILDKRSEEDRRIRTIMSGGTKSGIALSLAAELVDPANVGLAMLAPAGLARIGVGSAKLAAEGRKSAAVASSIAENLIGGTALEATKQSLEGKYNGEDLLVSLAADSLLGLGTGIYAARAARVLDAGKDAAIVRQLDRAQRAEAMLGTGASSSEIRKAMDSIAEQEIKDAVTLKPEVESYLKAASPESAMSRSVEVLPGDDLPQREAKFSPGGEWEPVIEQYSGGLVKNLAELHRLPAGVHATDNIPVAAAPAINTMAAMAKKFLGRDFRIVVDAQQIPAGEGFAHGAISMVSDKAALIRLDPSMSPELFIRSAAHEVGHAIFNKHIAVIPDAERTALFRAFEDMLKRNAKGEDVTGTRFSATNSDQGIGMVTGNRKLTSDYHKSWDEFSAEQIVKALEEDVRGANTWGLSARAVSVFKQAVDAALRWLGFAKKEYSGVSIEYKDFLNKLASEIEAEMPKSKTPTRGASQQSQFAVPAKPDAVVQEIQTDPDAIRLGLNLAPTGTAAERKQAQAMLALHKQAESWALANPKDAAWDVRVKNLSDNNVFNVASTGLLMLKSESPLARMIAADLLEDASGAAGKRKPTAAIDKFLNERYMMGNVINDIEGAFTYWNKAKGGSLYDDLVVGKNRADFHKEIAAEIEARRTAGGPVSQDGNIKAAADSIEAAYQRSANAQRAAQTLGADGLPPTSVGYMPHRMNPKAVISRTNDQLQVVHSALVDQFVTVSGWDISFSDMLASKYLQRVKDRAAGNYGSSIGGGNASSASLVEEALRSMDLPEVTIKEHMDNFNKGAANFTKGRIELDLNKVHKTATGDFRLLDIFETNQIELLRAQVGRASGDVALTKFGVKGKPGLQLLRDAMQYGADGAKAGNVEKEAFDQIAAEFLNEPFGTASSKWMERAMAANALVRLGGIAFNQLAESINGIFHVGAARTMSSVTGILDMRREIKDLVAGKQVNNPILSSIEQVSGAEFGTDAYKIVMPYDSPDHAYPTYGQDTLTMTDRLLRGGGHLQSKISGWRTIHSAQQRGMAQQIVLKTMRYINEGKDDIALDQMGVTANMRAALKRDMPNIATFESNGELTSLAVSKITDPAVRDALIQTVWRGTNQIIQGTFIGERGKWAHDGWMKLFTQFKAFSLTSMEKQWGRQRNSRGSAAAFGMMMGAMSIATPIYMARVYANSIGRDDQEAYLEERLQPQNVARATLNYIAMGGMAGDFLDLTTSVLPEELGVKPTGGRTGVESNFVGTYILPASSIVDDVYKYAQSPTNMDDAAKILPMSRVPLLVPFVNALKDSD